MPKRSSKHLSFLYLTAQQKVVHLHALFAFQLDFLQAQYAIAGLVHLGSFALAVCGLALTALFTFWIYNAIFGRKPINEVHAEKALHSLEELGYDASMVKVAKVEEQEGFDEGADGTPVGTGGAVYANDDGIIDVTGDVVDK